MQSFNIFLAIVGLGLACLALFLMFAHVEPGIHDHPYETGDFICVRGVGYFPEVMYEPGPFMVCGDITELEEPTPLPPAEGEPRLDNESRHGA